MHKSRRVLTVLLTAILALSFLAGAIPIAPVHAAAPAISVSPTSGRGALGDTFFGESSSATEVTVTGSGFDSGQDNIQLRMAPTTDTVSTTAGFALELRYVSIIGSSGVGYVKADAMGNWKALFRVHSREAQTYNMFAVYTPTGGATTYTTPVVFTVTADMLVKEELSDTSAGIYGSRVHILLTGFRASESVSLIPTNFLVTAWNGTTAFSSFNVDANGCTLELTTNKGYITARTGGTINVIVFGSSSGVTVSKSFTINPSIAVCNSTVLSPTLSISPTPSTLYLYGRNWISPSTATTIPANSLKIISAGGTVYSTSHSSISLNSTSNGSFDRVAVTYFDMMPTQPLSVKLYDITFSLSAANIIPTYTLFSAQLARGTTLYPVAGSLIASDPARPDYAELTATTFMYGGSSTTTARARSALYAYVVNGLASTSWNYTISSTDTPPVYSSCTGNLYGMTTTDANGAGLALFWYLPSGSYRAFGDHTLQFTGAVSGTTATLRILPYVMSLYYSQFTTKTTSNPGYKETVSVRGYGFKPNENIDVSVEGLSWFSVPTTSIGADGSFNVESTGLPKLASGSHTIVFKGSTSDNTYSRSITTKPTVIRDTSLSLSEPLTTNAAAVGDPVTLRSSATLGVFGLKANTLHDVTVGGVKVASFTSTSDGTISGAVSFMVPSLRSGLYYVDIVDTTTGKSAIFGLTRQFYATSYSSYQATTSPTGWNGDEFTSYKVSAYAAVDAGSGLRLTVTIKLNVSPTATSPGTALSISGSGLATAKKYYISLSTSSTVLAGAYAGFSLGDFVTTAEGAIPSGVSITVPDVPNSPEAGQAWYIHASDVDQLGALTSTGYGNVVLYASATIAPTRGEVGSRVDMVLKGATAGRLYNIIFGYSVSDSTVSGTVVGSVVADSVGKATTFFTVPSLANGEYKIQLYDSIDADYKVLNLMPAFTIGAPPAPPVGTGTFTPSEPKLLNSAGTAVTSISKNTAFYTQVKLASNVGTSVSVYVIAQIKDSAGKVVAMGITAADVAAGATKNVPVAFLGISTAGTYTVTIFVWSSITEPTALAPTTAFTITIT